MWEDGVYSGNKATTRRIHRRDFGSQEQSGGPKQSGDDRPVPWRKNEDDAKTDGERLE